MPSDYKEIDEIKKKLENHERRIEELEKLVKRKKKEGITERKTISDHLSYLKSEGFLINPTRQGKLWKG